MNVYYICDELSALSLRLPSIRAPVNLRYNEFILSLVNIHPLRGSVCDRIANMGFDSPHEATENTAQFAVECRRWHGRPGMQEIKNSEVLTAQMLSAIFFIFKVFTDVGRCMPTALSGRAFKRI